MAKKNPRLTDDGFEVPDDTPVAMPVKFRRPEALAETVQRLVQGQLSRMAEAQGFESFDDADDFDVGDDYDPRSPYELDDGQVEYDIRNDDRYKARAVAEEKLVREGAREEEGDIREGGEGTDESQEGNKRDKRKPRKDVNRVKPVER